MTILAGLDEAGYGPHLGPLVVAAAAVRVPEAWASDGNLWSALRGWVRKRPRGTSSRVVICDSKTAYTACGAAPLERATLGFLAACRARPATLSELEAATRAPFADNPAGSALHPPWHRPQSVRLPAHQDADAIETASGYLARGLGRIGGRCERLWVNAAPASRFNHLLDTTGNKAGVLFALAADLLTAIHRRWPGELIHVTMDRHGGRRYYGDLLAQAFPLQRVHALQESPRLSVYSLARADDEERSAPLRITIRNRCEQVSLATALASMAAKYVRELHMRQLNEYFQSLTPGLRPTAGYGRDAWRFLDDVTDTCRMQGVPEATILRYR